MLGFCSSDAENVRVKGGRVMKEKKTAKKGSRNAQPERLPETNTKALNHEQEKLRQWFQEVKIPEGTVRWSG